MQEGVSQGRNGALTEGIEFIETKRAVALALCDAARMVHVPALEEPHFFLVVEPRVEFLLALVALLVLLSQPFGQEV